jgi:hypothetical protein
MLQLRLLAIGAFAMLSATASAFDGCCPEVASPCGCPPVPVPHAVARPVEMLVVNQGPVYSGPGSYVTQRNFVENDQVVPHGFPRVGYIPADTHGPGYRGFYSGTFYPGHVHGHHGPRFRMVYAKPARMHVKAYSAYK